MKGEVSEMASEYKETAKVFKAFCDENRLQILDLLRSGEKCACEILDGMHISQSTLSHHMKILCDADIVRGRKEGKWVHYSINQLGAEHAKELLSQQVLEIPEESGEGLPCCCKE